MTGRTSQKAPSREARTTGIRGRLTVLSLITGLAFVATVFLAVDHFPDNELGRAIDAYLTRLADPESWIR